MGIFGKLFGALKKTKDNFSEKLRVLFSKNKLGDEFYQELEEILISSDLWVTTAEEVVVAKTAIEETVDEEELESETNGGKFKSFSVRLSQCSPEVIEYYNEIKNELLSYKKVKAKISLRHNINKERHNYGK